jgi:hypothetical protein
VLISHILRRLRWSRRGPFHRSCNFCGGTRFRVFKRLPEVRFPPQIYADHPLADPAVGERLSLQYLERTWCGLIAIDPLPRFAEKPHDAGERSPSEDELAAIAARSLVERREVEIEPEPAATPPG